MLPPVSKSFLDLLEDPRVERNKRHALPVIVLVMICTAPSGAQGWEVIEQFGQEKHAWLRRFAPFVNGAPSQHCRANVISRLKPKHFQGRCSSWTQTIAVATEGEKVALDGKRPAARGIDAARATLF